MATSILDAVLHTRAQHIMQTGSGCRQGLTQCKPCQQGKLQLAVCEGHTNDAKCQMQQMQRWKGPQLRRLLLLGIAAAEAVK